MQKGFTIIEMMIVVVILGILFLVAAPAMGWIDKKPQGTSYGPQQRAVFEVPTECVSGYKFIVNRSAATQILDSKGHGIPC